MCRMVFEDSYSRGLCCEGEVWSGLRCMRVHSGHGMRMG